MPEDELTLRRCTSSVHDGDRQHSGVVARGRVLGGGRPPDRARACTSTRSRSTSPARSSTSRSTTTPGSRSARWPAATCPTCSAGGTAEHVQKWWVRDGPPTRGGDRGALRPAHRRDGADPDVGGRGQRRGRSASCRTTGSATTPSYAVLVPGPGRDRGRLRDRRAGVDRPRRRHPGAVGAGCSGPGGGSPTRRRTSRRRTTATWPRCGCWPRSASPRASGSTSRSADGTGDPSSGARLDVPTGARLAP